MPLKVELTDLYKEPRDKGTEADLADLLSNPVWLRVAALLQQKAVRLRSKTTDPNFTLEAAKAEGVNDALGEIDRLFRQYQAKDKENQ